MGNLRERVKVRLVSNAKEYKKYVRKPSFVSQKMFSNNFVAFYEIKSDLILDKQIYVGFDILDLSKLLMDEFHRKYLGTKYDNWANFLFTDTYSLVYELETNEVYKIFMKIRIYLILVTIKKIQIFWSCQYKSSLKKMKLKEKYFSKFFWLK